MRGEGTVAEVLAGEARFAVQHQRAEEMLRALPDGCVNLHWIDPPYYRVVDEEWDRAWKTEADFLAWLAGIVAEAARTLAPNGSVYVFASPQMGGRVEGIVRERLDVLNHLVWAKPERPMAEVYGPENFRQFVPMSERVIFAETRGAETVGLSGSGYAAKCDEARAEAFAPLRAYLADELARSGWTPGRLNEAMGFAPRGMAETRYFSRSAWQLPTERHYETMRRILGDGFLPRSYADVRAEYERLRVGYDDECRSHEALRRPFVAPESFTDVWTYAAAPNAATRHPCEKPAAMLRDVVRCSSRANDLVCEPFGGSFRMAEVALAEGRRYFGCDADAHWYGVGAARARAAVNGTAPVVAARKTKAATDARQPSLFGDGAR